jgi:hypothetical protein
MKENKFIVLALALALTATAAVFTGCTTTPTGGPALDPQKASKIAPIVQTSASSAVVYAYTKNTNTVLYADVIMVAIKDLIVTGNLEPAVLQAKLYALPIKELKTAEAQLILTPLLSAYKAYGEEYVRNGLVSQEGWKILSSALVNGLQDGIAGVAQIKAGEGK